MDGSDIADSSDGGGLYTLMTEVSWILVTSHSMLEPGGDWLMADQVSSVLTKVATPCCLL